MVPVLIVDPEFPLLPATQAKLASSLRALEEERTSYLVLPKGVRLTWVERPDPEGAPPPTVSEVLSDLAPGTRLIELEDPS